MKFCVVERSDGYLYGSEYEEPYRYSEYTAGGGCWDSTFVSKEHIIGEEEEQYKVYIFEDRDSAQKIVDSYSGNNFYYNSNKYTYKVISILTLESRFEENRK